MKTAKKEPRAKRKKGIRVEMTAAQGISASISGNILTVKGSKGEVKREIKQKNVSVRVEGNKLVFETARSTKKDKKMANSLAAHAKNMIRGAAETHTYMLKICAGHFPITVTVADKKLSVKNFLGEKVPRVLSLKEGAVVKVEGSMIHVTSVDKEIAGQVSAGIEQLTRRPGFDSRIFQDGIYITNKDGKELK